MNPRLKQKYHDEVAGSLVAELGLRNVLAAPRLSRVVVSMGVKAATSDRKRLDVAVDELTKITGQKAVVTKARKAISGFRLREGMDVGCFVTLRGNRMYEFVDRLISVVLPRVRDFRGLNPDSFDGHGNFSFGLTEQGIFPEIDPDKVTNQQGMNIVVVTTAENDAQGRTLLKKLGFPYRK